MEHDTLVVKYQDELDDGSEEMVSGYFEKVGNRWILTGKKVALCEIFKKNTCDRMPYKHEIDTKIMRLLTENVPNKTKRYMLYRYYTMMKSGRLGQGNRKKVQSCVQPCCS